MAKMESKFIKILIGSIIASLVLGFFAGSKYKVYQINKAVNSSFISTNGSGYDREELIEELDIVPVEYDMSQELELATITLKINSVEEIDTIVPDYGKPVTARQGAKFVIVNLDITNKTNSPFTFWSEGIVLKDSQGRSFKPSDQTWTVNDYIEARELSPSMLENGNMVFELPEDSVDYFFSIMKGGSNEECLIKLQINK